MRFWLRRPDDYRIIFMRQALRAPDESGSLRATGCCRGSPSASRRRRRPGWDKTWAPEAAALAMWAAVSGPVALRLAFPDLNWPPEDEHVKATIDMIIQGCEGAAPRARQAARRRAGALSLSARRTRLFPQSFLMLRSPDARATARAAHSAKGRGVALAVNPA